MPTLRCGLLLSVLSYQLLAFTAVAQNACIYSPTKKGICRPYAECMEIHDKLIFPNAACKENTYCCPNILITPPLSDNKNNYSPDDEDVNAERIASLFNEDLNPSQFGNEYAPTPASNPNFNTIWNTITLPEPVQKNPKINYPWVGNKPINPSVDWPEILVGTVDPEINDPWDEEDGYFKQPVNYPEINDPMDEEEGYWNNRGVKGGINPSTQVNFISTLTTPKPITTTTVVQKNPKTNYPWHEDKPINPSVDWPEIPVGIVDPEINDPWDEEDGYFKQHVNYPEINDPRDEEEGYWNNRGVKGAINPATQVNFISTLTTPKPITTTTEAIPIFDKEFYRRLGLSFGNKYNRYQQQPTVTPENSTEDDTKITITEEVTTNSSNFMENLNLSGLHKLSAEKCGFVHYQNNPSESNVEAHLLEIPWLALLHYTGDAKNTNFSCGGSLITERWVLTAASCIKKTLIGVRLGEYEISEKSKRDCVQKSCSEHKDFKIATMVKHPHYKPETGVKDIALIKLKTRAKKSKNIKPICLPTKVEYFNVPYDNMSLTISGWGLNKEGATKVMKKHAINRSKIQACKQANPKQPVHKSKLCLATVDEEPSTCSGDPGSPVSWIVDDSTRFVTQIGVVPFGMDKCGAADGVVSTYYVESVADSMDWITTVIGEDV